MKKIFITLLLFSFTSLIIHSQNDIPETKTIKGITDKMLEVISGDINEPRDWETYRQLFLPSAQKTSLRPGSTNLRDIRNNNIEEFIRNVGPIFARDGFEEVAIGLTINEYNGIATAFQSYNSKNLLGTYEKRGINCYQLIYVEDRWWIVSTIFAGEDANNPIPEKYLNKIDEELPKYEGPWTKLKTENYGGKQDDICFIDEKNGWYINGLGKLYGTTDGGESWQKLYEKKGSFFRTVAFIDKNNGFLGTVGTDYFPNVEDTIALYRTKDGGQNWTPVDYNGPYVKGLCAIDIVEETYINHGRSDVKQHLYGVGRVGSPANILISHDNGQTWTSKDMSAHCQMLFDIKMLDKNIGYACAGSDANTEKSNAVILKTIDGGQSWKKVYQSNRPYEITWKVSFPSDKVGYVTIQSYNPDKKVQQQRIAKTIDGGENWREINLVKDHGSRSFGVGFIDELHGFVGTMNSGYETLDGGLNWKKINLGKACNKIRIYRDQNNKVYGYAIGVDVYKLNLK